MKDLNLSCNLYGGRQKNCSRLDFKEAILPQLANFNLQNEESQEGGEERENLVWVIYNSSE